MIFANKLLKTLLITTYLTESVISSHGDVFEVTNAESDSDIGKFVKDLKDAVKKGTKSTTPLSITQNSDCSDLSVDGKHKLEKKEIVDIGQKLIAQEQADQQQKKSTIKKLKKVFNADSENICKWISTYFENALTKDLENEKLNIKESKQYKEAFAYVQTQLKTKETRLNQKNTQIPEDEEKIKDCQSRLKTMEGSPSTAQIAYNFTSEGAFFQMPGVAVWVPKDNPEDAKVYIAMKRNYYERIPIAASALDIFDYSSNMHTERQLVLCALATDSSKSKGDDQLLQDAIQLTNDKCEITGSKGTLYIYLPAPPCDTLSSNNYNDLGGMSCFRYYQRLNEKLSSKKIFVFFDNTSTIPYTPTDFDNGKIRFISVEDKPRAKNFQDTYDKTAKDEKNDLYQQAARVMLGNTCFKNVDASKLATCLKKNKADIDNMIAETKNLKDLIDLIEKIKDEQISSNENIQATVNSIQTAIKRTETDFDRLAEAPKSSAKNDIKMWIGSLRTAIINKVAKRLQSKTKQQINISKK